MQPVKVQGPRGGKTEKKLWLTCVDALLQCYMSILRKHGGHSQFSDRKGLALLMIRLPRCKLGQDWRLSGIRM